MTKLYQEFHEGPSGYPELELSDGTHITRTLNDQGITAYWIKIHPETNDDRRMMTWEEIHHYDLDPRNVMCRDQAGNRIYGGVILERVDRTEEGIVYDVWLPKDRKKGRIIRP